MRTREESRRTLAALNLPPIVMSIFEGVPAHEALRYRCEPPLHFFQAAVVVRGGEVTPLRECGVGVTAYQHFNASGRFVCFSLESPEEVSRHLRRRHRRCPGAAPLGFLFLIGSLVLGLKVARRKT